MAEDHGFQSAAGHRLCANSCGFFGSPATLNLCSKCYQSQSQSPQPAPENPTRAPVPAINPSPEPCAEPGQTIRIEVGPVVPNRCGTCRKRVGLMGFRCRCGVTCCGTHRYPEQHQCTWDYKAAGKETIARENPVVKAEKVARI